MIGTISTGKNFYQLTKYLLKPEQKAKVLRNSTIYDTAKEIASEFRRIAAKRPSTTKPVKHIAIAFATEDGKIDFYTKLDIATTIVERMGFTENQWLAVEHGRDVEHHAQAHNHDHLHIMINMISYDGTRVNDGWDYPRLEKILRDLEQQYNLKPVKSSKDRSSRRRPNPGQYQKFQREYNNWQQELKSNPHAIAPEEPEIQTLEAIISAAVVDKPTMTTYLARLQQYGYPVEKYVTDKGRTRLRYKLKSTPYPVHRLRGGSLTQLQKVGVDYLPERDDPNFLKAQQGIEIPLEAHQRLKKEQVEKYKYRWLPQEQIEQIRRNQVPTRKSVLKPTKTAQER
jgi:hypothetical protein